jgi:hypothetical protein
MEGTCRSRTFENQTFAQLPIRVIVVFRPPAISVRSCAPQHHSVVAGPRPSIPFASQQCLISQLPPEPASGECFVAGCSRKRWRHRPADSDDPSSRQSRGPRESPPNGPRPGTGRPEPRVLIGPDEHIKLHNWCRPPIGCMTRPPFDATSPFCMSEI